MKVALNSYPPGIPTGLGTMARTFAKLMPFDQVMSYYHPKFQEFQASMSDKTKFSTMQEMLHQVDCIVALERPLPGTLFREAKILGKRTVLVVMHEWINPGCAWLNDVDLFIAPNQVCLNKLYSMGLVERTRRLNLPLDLESLPFLQRTKADRFVFSNGWGGVNDRKGWPEMKDALTLMPQNERDHITLHSQKLLESEGIIPGVRYGCSLSSSQEMYEGQDVAVVPSRCEGLGYSILEPMALGLPVLVPDDGPMNEYVKGAYGELADQVLMNVFSKYTAPIWRFPVEYVKVFPSQIRYAIQFMKSSHGSFIEDLSFRGREWIESVMGPSSVNKLWEDITGAI